MFFHQSDVMKTMFVLLFSVNIVTASKGDDDDHLPDASNTLGEEDLEDGFSGSEHGPYKISDGVSEEVFQNYPYCWTQMQFFCSMKNPQAIDFAQSVIRKWKVADVFFNHNWDGYYKEFDQFLSSEKILSPDDFCATIDNEHTPRNEDKKTECQTVLSCFGATNVTALQHCFYEKISLAVTLTSGDGDFESILYNSVNFPKLNPDFTEYYMSHIGQKVNVKHDSIAILDEIFETNSSESEHGPYPISDGVTEVVFLRYPCCWMDMQAVCNVQVPTALDFAKAVIHKWRETEDFFLNPYARDYYDDFAEQLNAEDVLSPDDFCATLDTYQTLRIDGKTECQTELSCFGDTNESALQHCFFEKIKKEPINVLWARLAARRNNEDVDSLEYGMEQLTLSNRQDFTGKYMEHMSENVKVNAEITSPLQFCKICEEGELV